MGPATLSDSDGYVARSGAHLHIDTAHLQYVTVALIYSTLAIRYNTDCMITCAFRVFDLHGVPVFDRGGVLDVTCEFLSCRSRRPGLPLSGKPRTRDPLACAAKQSVSGHDV